jgi:hypothetical protein
VQNFLVKNSNDDLIPKVYEVSFSIFDNNQSIDNFYNSFEDEMDESDENETTNFTSKNEIDEKTKKEQIFKLINALLKKNNINDLDTFYKDLFKKKNQKITH